MEHMRDKPLRTHGKDIIYNQVKPSQQDLSCHTLIWGYGVNKSICVLQLLAVGQHYTPWA